MSDLNDRIAKSVPNDILIRTMVEYHQRYSKGRLVHRGLEAYCKHCARNRNVGDVSYSGARRLLLDQGWTLESETGSELDWWHCPNCRALFPEEADNDE